MRSFLIFILIFSVFRSISVSSKLTEIIEEPKDKISELIHHHKEELKEFFHTDSLNFIGLGGSETNKSLQIFEALTKEFAGEFSFNLFTDKFSSTKNNSKKFFWRFEEMEREGFVLHLKENMTLANDWHRIYRKNGFYLIIVDGEMKNGEEVLKSFRKMWKKIGSLSMMGIFNDKLWIYNPFTPPLEQSNGTFGALEPYHQRKTNWRRELLSNMNGYPLILEIFESGFNVVAAYKEVNGTKVVDYFNGPDGPTVDILRTKMNFTAIYQPPDKGDAFGSKQANGTFTGTLGRMIYKKSDLAITGFFIKDYLSPDIEFTVGIYQDELCLISKKASPIPHYILPLVCFEVDIWICLLITIILTTFIWAVIRQANHRIIDGEDMGWREFLQIGVDTVMLILSAPMRKFPKITSERSFIASICLLSLVIVAIFQSSLSTVFIKKLFYKDMMTFEDVAQSKLPIWVKYAAMMDDMFPPNSSTGVIEQLRVQMKLISTTQSLLAQMAAQGDFLSVTRKCTIYQDNSFYFSSGILHLIPQCPRIYNLAYLAGRNSIYIKRVNGILLQLNNGGFHEKWIRDLNYNFTWQTRMKFGSFHQDVFKVFTMTDLQLPFYILAFGFTCSGTVFIIEWVMHVKKVCL